MFKVAVKLTSGLRVGTVMVTLIVQLVVAVAPVPVVLQTGAAAENAEGLSPVKKRLENAIAPLPV
jgi:hypothetical protein